MASQRDGPLVRSAETRERTGKPVQTHVPERSGNREGRIRRTRIENHDFVAPSQGGQNLPQQRRTVFGQDRRADCRTGAKWDESISVLGAETRRRDLGFREAVAHLHPAQATLGREINPKVFSTTEFSAKAAKQAFLADVMAKPKIFLIGNAHELEQLAGHQP